MKMILANPIISAVVHLFLLVLLSFQNSSSQSLSRSKIMWCNYLLYTTFLFSRSICKVPKSPWNWEYVIWKSLYNHICMLFLNSILLHSYPRSWEDLVRQLTNKLQVLNQMVINYECNEMCWYHHVPHNQMNHCQVSCHIQPGWRMKMNTCPAKGKPN